MAVSALAQRLGVAVVALVLAVAASGCSGGVAQGENGYVLHIEIDVFSGRPNPTVDLEGSAAADALRALPRDARAGVEAVAPGTLGFRGLVVTGDLPSMGQDVSAVRVTPDGTYVELARGGVSFIEGGEPYSALYASLEDLIEADVHDLLPVPTNP